MDRDVRLARAGREAQERARFAASDLLEHRPDRGVLVVAPARLAAAVRRAQRAGQLRRQVQAAGRFPANAELVRGGEVRHRGGSGRQAGRGVELDPLVAVRAEDERDVQAGRAPRVLAGVLLRLVEPARGCRVRPLRLHDRDRDWLRVRRDLDPERVVRPPGPGAPRPPVHDLDRPRRLLAPDQLLGPAGGVEGGIEEGDSDIAFEQGHVTNATRRTVTRGRARDERRRDTRRGRAAWPGLQFSLVLVRCSAAAARGAAVEALVAAAVADHDRAAVGAAGRVLLDLERGSLRAQRGRQGRHRAGLAVAVRVAVPCLDGAQVRLRGDRGRS